MMLVFQERLKELRLENELSAKELGKILGVRDTKILRWEKGSILPSIEHLYNIAKYFNVSADYLIRLED